MREQPPDMFEENVKRYQGKTIVVPLSQVEETPAGWFTEPYSRRAIRFYVSRYRSGKYVRPPEVNLETGRIGDGTHRVYAARLAESEELPVIPVSNEDL